MRLSCLQDELCDHQSKQSRNNCRLPYCARSRHNTELKDLAGLFLENLTYCYWFAVLHPLSRHLKFFCMPPLKQVSIKSIQDVLVTL